MLTFKLMGHPVGEGLEGMNHLEHQDPPLRPVYKDSLDHDLVKQAVEHQVPPLLPWYPRRSIPPLPCLTQT